MSPFLLSSKKHRIFFSGIAGSGMSGLALFSRENGHDVSGSDRAFDDDYNNHLKQVFERAGIKLVPQNGEGVTDALDLAVFSTAVEEDRPEVLRAKSLGVRRMTRPDFLREIAGEFRTIAVAGTSGKSTASGMLAFLMEALGLGPNFIGGGRVKQFRTGTNSGNYISGESRFLVIEACESDGTLGSFMPEHSVILNLSLDHHPIEKTLKLFAGLAGNTSGTVFMNADDPNLSPLNPGRAITFSVERPSDFRAEDIRLNPLASEFSVNGVSFWLGLPGLYNIYNALSSIAALSSLDIPLKDISGALREFSGIERRFDIHLNDGRRLVIDDYAHNPHKIASLMEAARELRPEVCYIFQPHGFGPTRMMRDEYIRAFADGLRESDNLMLLPILYKGGTVARDISSETIAEGIRTLGKFAEAVSGREEIIERLEEHDCYIVLGARDDTLSDLAREMAARLR